MRTREMPTAKCFYFGSLKGDGHCLYAPDGRKFWNDLLLQIGEAHIDGALAPRRVRIGSRSYYKREDPSSVVCWTLQGETREDRDRLEHDSAECPQGQFLLHALHNGFTAVAWWDQCQGDTRPGSNSVILLRDIHTRAETAIAVGKEHFPQVFENLERKSVKLVDVTDYSKSLLFVRIGTAQEEPMKMTFRGAEHQLHRKAVNQRAVTHDGRCDVWECTCGKLFESAVGCSSEVGLKHLSLGTQPHTCTEGDNSDPENCPQCEVIASYDPPAPEAS
jgi:hypothetical protein